ncbi:unnamed protein product [Schistosoma curassoni]|uniref:Uncharacterized protein n=1 Tax=Schistosoma curassoni TaxID=6186 RepID=A0A183L2Q5_9TREM|nr:unnamed protein product [Schistosoma curassoni]
MKSLKTNFTYNYVPLVHSTSDFPNFHRLSYHDIHIHYWTNEIVEANDQPIVVPYSKGPITEQGMCETSE